MVTPYLIGFLTYCCAVMLSYSDKLKVSNWYFPIGLAIAMLSNTLWLYVAKHAPAKEDIYIHGLIWDAMIVGTYAVIPILFLGVRLSGWTLAGAIMIGTGLILTKVG